MQKNSEIFLENEKKILVRKKIVIKEVLCKFIKSPYAAVLLLVLIFCATRLPYLGPDEINPDGVNWHYRSQQFIVGLKSGDFERTYQHYHPGVTLMWITGVPIEIYKQVTGITTYDQHNFLAFNTVAKVSVVSAQLVLTLILLYLLCRTVGRKIAYISVLLLTVEPFFLGNSRLYHMDVLLALFLAIALLLGYMSLRRFTYLRGILTGVFLGLSFLTKSIGIGALLFVLFYAATYYAEKKEMKNYLKFFSTVLISFTLTAFILFPALWVKPFYYLGEIFSESERVGIRKGHEQIILGETVNDGGLMFYPIVTLMKITPFLLAGLILRIFMLPSTKNLVKKIYTGPYIYLGLFYLGYFLIMFYPTKKLDRYILPIFPFLTLFVSYTLVRFYRNLKTVKSKKIFMSAVVSGVILFYLLPLISFYPYFFTYTSPLFGTPAMANSVIAQKPFGIGVPALKDFILDKYDGEPELGFIDTKPIKSIYPNSKVSDIRVNGVEDYELMVLGVNEIIPDKVLESGVRFRKDASLFINDLEYWRIYVKEN